MLNPSIGKLINNSENRYELVLEVAKTAREISKEASDNKEIITEKPVSLAIDKLASNLD